MTTTLTATGLHQIEFNTVINTVDADDVACRVVALVDPPERPNYGGTIQDLTIWIDGVEAEGVTKKSLAKIEEQIWEQFN